MKNLMEVESWWKHNGCWDREQASGIPYDRDCDVAEYLQITDDWWDSLSSNEKLNTYEDFFSEL